MDSLGYGRLMGRDAASSYLKEKWGIERRPATLAKYACVGGGPRYYKAGRQPLYASPDLDTYALALLGVARVSTSEAN